MRASLTEIPGVTFNFSEPIKDNVEEAVSGVRGQVVLKIFGTDLDVMKTRSSSAGRHRQGAGRRGPRALSRRDGTAAAGGARPRRPARAGNHVDQAQDVVQTALAGTVATDFWENERPVPVRLMFPGHERDDEDRIGSIRFRPLAPATCRSARLRTSTAVGKAAITRDQQPLPR